MDTDLLLVIFGLGPTELIIIVAIILLVFGPKHIVRLGSAMGDTVRQVRRASNEDDDADEEDLTAEDDSLDGADSDSTALEEAARADDGECGPSKTKSKKRAAKKLRRRWQFWKR